ncbi:hypothetical protein B0T16DRAFT_13239 [Cercophora newfieldiana]|uniref:Uncharacterized protein n=1 Tax=Cercophora newfieldiana TaxID=92897 RepID=A0AA40CZZ9_9PEZI|nr:hypothetical protein B0T16DRAFT_13239 [Cercophora newfieldiana]
MKPRRYCNDAERGDDWRDVISICANHVGSRHGVHRGNIFASTSSCSPVSTATIWTETTAGKSRRYVCRPLLHTDSVADGFHEWHDAVLIPLYGLQPPNVRGKDVANSDTLLALLTFNIKHDTGIFPSEKHRVQLPGCYLGLAFTGARAAEFVDGEKRSSQDGCLQEQRRCGLTTRTMTKTMTRALMSILGYLKSYSRKRQRAADGQKRSVTRTSC